MDNIYVSLSESKGEIDLTKVVSKDYLNNSFRNLLEYMLDNREDANNSVYAQDKLRTLEIIKTIYDKGKTDNTFGLAYISSETNEPVKVTLDEVVGDQNDILISNDSLFDEEGMEQINLICAYRSIAGYE